LEEWVLSSADLEKIQELDQTKKYRSSKIPSTLTAMTENLTDGKVFIRAVYGLPGHQILSRFATPDEDLTHQTKEMADWDKANNQGVIFAEIIDWPGAENVANFNSRNIYTEYVIPLEFPLSGWPKEKQIFLSDLLVSVSYGKVRLRSKSLNKEIIPLMSSAYNYIGESNPYLKFLGLIATQDNFRRTSWHWGELREFPYLPRVRFGNVILSPRQWRLSKQIVYELTKTNSTLFSFRDTLKSCGIPEIFFIVTHTDQRLRINSTIDEILFSCLDLIKKNHDFYFEEILGLDHTEFLIPFKNLQPQKQDPYLHLEQKDFIESKVHHVGGDCVYAKFYANSRAMDPLLSEELSKFLNDQKKKKTLRYWFFLKYKDPSSHLRVRFFLRSPNLLKEFLKDLYRLEVDLYRKRTIWNFQLETYKRDYDGGEKNDWKLFDTFSFKDSERHLELLTHGNFLKWDSTEKWLYVIKLAHEVLHLSAPSLKQKLEASKKLRCAYETMGFKATAEQKERFLVLWREEKETIKKSLKVQNQVSYFRGIENKDHLLSPQRLFHLSLNRTMTDIKYFEEDQIYALLYKAYMELSHS
jgi:thiopeptide-type bacteriocin biosynthesis protein